MHLNSELESIVENRTTRLGEIRHIIESQNEILQNDIHLKNRILSIIGHDIRSPLAFVVMGLELIADKDLPEANRTLFVNKMLFAVNNLFLLVDNLLSWGTSQNKQLKLFPEQYDLSLLVNRIYDHFLPLAENKEIAIEMDIPSATSAWFDENTIIIVVRNLLSNAIKFTPHKGTISITISDTENIVEVKVADSGIGFAPEKIKHINEGVDIKSTEGTDNEKGTGLGLILCKELVTLNGGLFSIHGQPGIGSVFSFTLPKNQPV
jgi:two-component system sensor histidine kinase/response regulator